jgi:dihydrofolate synthase / folylpolyglutamate synthase
VSIFERMAASAEKTDATFFECLTVMAFIYFAAEKADIAVVETGLGGRLDATNTLIPELSVITEIGLDHTRILGKTLERIAAEKAGILKPNVPCVSGTRFQRVNRLLEISAEKTGSPLEFTRNTVRFLQIRAGETGSVADVQVKSTLYRNLLLNLAGKHQLFNMGTALLSVDSLRQSGWIIPETAVREGLAQVRWPARMELVQQHPKILLDSAHNPMGMRRLAHNLQEIYQYRQLILIFGVLADKDYRAMLRIILPLSGRIILTRPRSDRALPPENMEPLPELRGKMVSVIPDIGEALDLARSMAGPDDIIVGAGSIYFVGELLKIIRPE